jgi:hypothetical protein
MRDSKDRGERHSRGARVEPAAALLRRAPTVAGEEVAEAERRGGSGSDCAVLLSIAMREDLEGIEGMFGGCHGSDRGACIYKEAEMVGVRGLMALKPPMSF